MMLYHLLYYKEKALCINITAISADLFYPYFIPLFRDENVKSNINNLMQYHKKKHNPVSKFHNIKSTFISFC